MDYIEKQLELENYLKTLGKFDKTPGEIVLEINEIGNRRELTLSEVGGLYEVAERLLKNELNKLSLPAAIGEKLTYPNPRETERLTDDLIDWSKNIRSPFSPPPPAPPAPIRDLIETEDIKGAAEIIAERQKLDDKKRVVLVDLIDRVLLGKAKVSNFRQDLVQGLGVSYDQALKISSDVNDSLFNRVMDRLKQAELEPVKTTSQPIKLVRETPTKTPAPVTAAVPVTVTAPIQEPKKLIPDHEEMEKREGVHVHNQTTMPVTRTFTKPPAPVSAPAPTPPVSRPTPQFKPAPVFKSIVDQKLSGLVRSSSIPTPSTPPSNLPTGENLSDKPNKPIEVPKYKGPDPYREPIE